MSIGDLTQAELLLSSQSDSRGFVALSPRQAPSEISLSTVLSSHVENGLRSQTKQKGPYHKPLQPLLAKCMQVWDRPDTAMKLSLFINFLLFLTKLAISILSNSIVIIASFIESLFDLVVQATMLCIQHKINKNDGLSIQSISTSPNSGPSHKSISKFCEHGETCNISGLQRYRNHSRAPECTRGAPGSSQYYPIGRTRYEGIATIVVSTSMIISSSLVIFEASYVLYTHLMARHPIRSLSFNIFSVVSYVAVVVCKIVLWLYCRRAVLTKQSLLVRSLAIDHFNDILSNSVALVCASVASKWNERFWWFDSTGAILISLYVIAVWLLTCKRSVNKVVGKSINSEYVGYIGEIVRVHPTFGKIILDIANLSAYYVGNDRDIEVFVCLVCRESVSMLAVDNAMCDVRADIKVKFGRFVEDNGLDLFIKRLIIVPLV